MMTVIIDLTISMNGAVKYSTDTNAEQKSSFIMKVEGTKRDPF